jgi:hypothetical protein
MHFGQTLPSEPSASPAPSPSLYQESSSCATPPQAHTQVTKRLRLDSAGVVQRLVTAFSILRIQKEVATCSRRKTINIKRLIQPMKKSRQGLTTQVLLERRLHTWLPLPIPYPLGTPQVCSIVQRMREIVFLPS